ncbi:hypothetical protein [Adhaeribacter pallidiroseus]|uniref:Nucleotide-diphospho-sugar transferase domain-containing protein n=1 Tax=Adhaeribacter pallidiroseus TaxID=2072847 RepID=A0A369QHA9_9BACT|nr:hypothetical protein [Adhaeribacter pallidiroseus]RDC64114.1 hypothetical protein AHMF7616_02724 [Adhaeribacter pallidiroseus]
MVNGSDKIILFLVYGSANSYYQVVFSILTLYFHIQSSSDQIKIVVYTNNAELLNKYLPTIPLIIKLISDDDIKEYRGKQDFNHRMKILVIDHCMREFNCDILYVDGDTFFLKSPLNLIYSISENVSLMHTPEYDMYSTKSENCFKLTLRRTLEDPVTLNDASFRIPLTTIMWNAGVIGISNENISLLGDVLTLTDQLYGSRPVHTAEQFAFSFVLQSNTEVIAADDYIQHYWMPNERAVYNKVIKSLFKNILKVILMYI